MKLFGTMNVEENILSVGAVKLSKLAEEFGTPLYIMDEEQIEEKCKSYYENFKCEERGNKVAYAGKAFLTLAMCKLIEKEGLCLDVVSGGELYTAHKAEFPLEKVLFHGNNKTLEEMRLGVSLGVGTFVVDNFYELEHLNHIAKDNGKVQNVYLRITPGIEAHTHEYIKTGQIDSKFGFAPVGDNILNGIKKAISLENINLAGLHCHIGSQIFEIEPYEDATEIMLKLINKVKEETGYLIKELDLGGGFGIYYSSEDSPKETKEYCQAILAKADNVCKELELEMPTLIIEPGRSIVGNAGMTLYTVGSIKDIPEIRKYVSVDGGMSDNIRPALYNASYECIVANRVIHDSNEKITIAGKCCESGDILLQGVEIPSVLSGDLLAVMSTGAYGYSMSNNYNKIPKAAVVMVKDGKSRVVCKRESYDDILKNEVM
ncbi:MAG: diaminopimelate decarboxylase [Clostridium sp.]|uniref:diaminopimelate decarboxylase n=1 Tax=Clostridium sp. TaxID=1506 RepID=UPI003F34B570